MTEDTDIFLDDTYVIRRLVMDYNRHGGIIIAYDYDNTVYDYHRIGLKFTKVIELLRECRPYAKFIVYTHSNEDRHPYIIDYLNENDIPWDTINEGIVWANGKQEGKLFYSHFLDDRAGLSSAYRALKIAIHIIKSGITDLVEINKMIYELTKENNE
jgi:hypothetical protein